MIQENESALAGTNSKAILH